ncbi:hypothetical protein RAS2_03150 [Phycisphaerae bacterium RAS2]|nr:hypothetical protein RAS2_03150 [Phycisphaerae bacterium RAS2]
MNSPCEPETGVSRVLVTGATGYIGGRLVPRLLAAGYRVRCLARDARKLASRVWIENPNVEIVECDIGATEEVARAMRGCDAAYYLVHSMLAAGPAYRRVDRDLAESFARSARDAGLVRIIYLGGLGETGDGLSEHLSSRREVENALASTGVPVTVFRAAMIIGSGSASFEILRYLVERLPVMVTPRWVHTRCQPIAVRDVLHYLVACLEAPSTLGRTLDIGGPDVLTYRTLMDLMSDALGLRRRRVIPVPVLTPRLSSLWIHLVTPISHRIARPLAEGLRNRVVCRDHDVLGLLPHDCMTVREAIFAALGKRSRAEIESSWIDAGPIPGDADWAGGKVFIDRRRVEIAAPPEAVFEVINRLGGDHGYFAADWLWRLRGAMDRIVGGPGLRRGRRHPTQLAFGEALDFWRVTKLEAGRLLELRAEMRLPGIATLTFEAIPRDKGGSVLIQTARFKPLGLAGIAYWYAVAPLHGIVFQGMLDGIRAAAESGPVGPRASCAEKVEPPKHPMATSVI